MVAIAFVSCIYFITRTKTDTYSNHGFSMEVPAGYVPNEVESEGGPSTMIGFPNGFILYVFNTDFWEEEVLSTYSYVKDEKIGENIFKVYMTDAENIYWIKNGKNGYEFHGDKNQLLTFKILK